MNHKMKKSSLIEGAAVAYAAILLTKLMGALYNIPLYSIIGDKGGVVYSYAYSIYGLFLDISTSGIPIAISIVISKYNSLEKYQSKEKAYRLGLRIVIFISIAAFIFLFAFAKQIGLYFLQDMTSGVTVDEIALGVRAVSFCILIVPFLSMKRGYLQGHKFLTAPSHSQVIEQLVRIVFVLVGAYVTVNLLHRDVTLGVCVALLGAAVGAAAAQVYLQHKYRTNRQQFPRTSSTETEPESTGLILRTIFLHCASIVLVSITLSVYNLVDLKMLLFGLHHLKYSDQSAQLIASVASTWIPKICMMISALSVGLASSITPFIAESFAKEDLKSVNLRLNQAMGMVLAVSIPLGAGMIIFSEPIYCLFYGANAYGSTILKLAVIVNVFGSLTTVVSMGMQSMGRGKSVCLHTIIGVLINTALDLPLIYLFDAVGLPAYLGASAASIVGQIVTLSLLLGTLKKSGHFSYKPVLRIIARALPSGLVMSVIVLGLKYLFPVTADRGLLMIIQLLAFALVGAAVYLPLAYATHMLQDVLGEDIFNRIRIKLTHKKE